MIKAKSGVDLERLRDRDKQAERKKIHSPMDLNERQRGYLN